MLKSMTGYGRCKELIDGRDITVEIRSVNSRYLETTVKINRVYGPLEDKLKQLVSSYISRGKVDVYVSVECLEGEKTELSLNREYLEAYIAALNTIHDEYGIDGEVNLRMLCGKPEIFISRKVDENLEEVWNAVKTVADKAFGLFVGTRETEGERLKKDLLERVCLLESMREKLLVLAPESVKEANEKMKTRIQELLGEIPVDESRLLTECAVYADKCDVTEEMVRLGSHFEEMRAMMQMNTPVGRKMDFQVQEINREVNTTGSKCSDREMAKIVIEMKAEIEKIREQIQNIE